MGNGNSSFLQIILLMLGTLIALILSFSLPANRGPNGTANLVLSDRIALRSEVYNWGSIHSRFDMRLVIQTCDASQFDYRFVYITPHKRQNVYRKSDGSYLVVGGTDQIVVNPQRIELMGSGYKSPGELMSGREFPQIEAMRCPAPATCVASKFINGCYVGAFDFLSPNPRGASWRFKSHTDEEERDPKGQSR